jgi:hypothetical protein
MSRIIQPKAEPNHAQASVALAAHEAEPKPSSAVKNVKDMTADEFSEVVGPIVVAAMMQDMRLKPAVKSGVSYVPVGNALPPPRMRSKPTACECCGRGYAGEASAGLSWSNRAGKWACVRCHFASASTSKTSLLC